MSFEGTVTVGALRGDGRDVLGAGFARLWPVEDSSSSFESLLQAIDDAERSDCDGRQGDHRRG